MTPAEAQTALETIDAILNAGVSSASVGDKTVTYDLPALRRRRSELLRIINGSSVRVGRYNPQWSGR